MDTGFIVYNDRNYPQFERLLEGLGVATQPSTMSFSVSDGRGDFEYSGASANGLFANRRHLAQPGLPPHGAGPAALQPRGARARRPERRAARRWGSSSTRAATRAQFVEQLIVPQASAVWSADPRQMWTFPASFLAEFFANHGMFGLTAPPATGAR